MATNVNMNTSGNPAIQAAVGQTLGANRPRYSNDAGKGGMFNLSGGRGPMGLVVVGIHVVLLYAIGASMGMLPAPKLAEPLEAVIIDQPVEKSEPVEVVKPELEMPVVETPPIENTIPEIEIPVEQPAPDAITAETSSAPPVGETANMTVSRRVDPVYPPASRRAGEEGTGMFRVLVDANGRPSQVEVVKSSGFPRLDEAAMQAIRKWAFKPAMNGGQAVQSWTRVQVAFKLENS